MSETNDRLYLSFLVVRLQTGDEAAFEEIVGRYTPRLRYYLAKALGSERDVDVEDVLQEVWFDVFRATPRLADPAAFPAWLYRIARDRAFRHLRRRSPPTEVIEVDGLTADEAGAEFTAEEAAQVHAALDRIEPEQREVLVLRFLEGLSYEEIAQVVGCPLGTVRSRLHYGKRALRRLLEPET